MTSYHEFQYVLIRTVAAGDETLSFQDFRSRRLMKKIKLTSYPPSLLLVCNMHILYSDRIGIASSHVVYDIFGSPVTFVNNALDTFREIEILSSHLVQTHRLIWWVILVVVAEEVLEAEIQIIEVQI